MLPGFICLSSDKYLNGLECWNQKKTSRVPTPQRSRSLFSFDAPQLVAKQMRVLITHNHLGIQMSTIVLNFFSIIISKDP